MLRRKRRLAIIATIPLALAGLGGLLAWRAQSPQVPSFLGKAEYFGAYRAHIEPPDGGAARENVWHVYLVQEKPQEINRRFGQPIP